MVRPAARRLSATGAGYEGRRPCETTQDETLQLTKKTPRSAEGNGALAQKRGQKSWWKREHAA